MIQKIYLLSGLILISVFTLAQTDRQSPTNFTEIQPDEPLDTIVLKAAHVRPSPRQIAWQELEFTCFFHFGMNTFTNCEWGLKNTDPSNFNPTELDAGQWIRTAKMAGAKLVVMVAKHHDGFCLWPTAFTDYSVKKSPWKNGKGDVIAEVAAACRENGMKLGIYLSPWDISSPVYGSGEYNDHFKNQLRELLTNYGEISEVWFDGACGEGPNGKRQVYDWQGYYTLIRELQPNAVIAVMGPDVRWVGTESGYGRETEWSVVPLSTAFVDEIAKNSQHSVSDGVFIPPGNMMETDIGSRKKIKDAGALIWYPSEVDVSIRPGWFYHEDQDSLVKSPEKLVDIYFSSVGRNSVLLLNLPPDKRGLIHENDVKSLEGMRQILDSTFAFNLILNSIVKTNPENPSSDPMSVLDTDSKTYWTTGEVITTGILEFDLVGEKTFDCLMLQENFRTGQRVEDFVIEIWKNNRWEEVTKGTTIGYKRLLRFDPVKAQRVRLSILSSRDNPEISTVGLYKLHEIIKSK
jgi:alpha-L-fucosidase